LRWKKGGGCEKGDSSIGISKKGGSERIKRIGKNMSTLLGGKKRGGIIGGLCQQNEEIKSTRIQKGKFDYKWIRMRESPQSEDYQKKGDGDRRIVRKGNVKGTLGAQGGEGIKKTPLGGTNKKMEQFGLGGQDCQNAKFYKRKPKTFPREKKESQRLEQTLIEERSEPGGMTGGAHLGGGE